MARKRLLYTKRQLEKARAVHRKEFERDILQRHRKRCRRRYCDKCGRKPRVWKELKDARS